MGPSFAGLGPFGENVWLAVLVDASLKGVVLLVAAALICFAWRRAAAAQRHLIWCMALCGILVLPLLSLALPAWQVGMLPRWDRGEPVPAGDARDMPSDSDGFGETFDVEVDRADALAQHGGDGSAAQATDALVRAEQDRAGQGTRTAGTLNPSVLLLALWALGALAVLAPHVIGLLLLRRLAARAQPIDDPRWSSLLENMSRQLGLRRRVRLLAAGQTVMPMTWGVLRPTVLLPADAEAWADSWRRVVLLHELAHVKRWDFVTQGLARLACAIYWFHALVWLAARALRRHREQACDDCVLAAGTPASTYAARLLDLAWTLRATALPTLPMARCGHLEGRLLAILSPELSRNGVTRVATLVTATLAFCAIVPLAAIRPTARAESETVEPSAARAQQQDQSSALGDEEGTDPPPPGVVRVFGSERFRTWSPNRGVFAVSPEGTTIATAFNRNVQFTDLESGQILKMLEVNSGAAAMAFQPKGETIATGTFGGTLEIWSIAEAKNLLVIQAHLRKVSSVVFTKDGSALITGGYDGKIKFWNADSGKLLQEFQAHEVPADANEGVYLALSSDGARLVSGGPDGRLKLWDASTGRILQQADAHLREVTGVAISSDGSWIASLAPGLEAKVWDAASLELVQTIEPPDRGEFASPSGLAFTPNGDQLAVGFYWTYGSQINLFDVKTGAEVGETTGSVDWVWSLGFTPGGKSLVSVSYDNAIRVWDSKTLVEQSLPLIHKNALSSVAFSPNGQRLATTAVGDETVYVWDVPTGRLVRQLEFDAGLGDRFRGRDEWQVAFSPHGERLLVADKKVFVWDVATGRQQTLPLVGRTGYLGSSPCFGPEGDLLALASFGDDQHRVTVWDLETKRIRFEVPVSSMVTLDIGGEQRQIGVRGDGVVLTSEGRVIACDAEGFKAWDMRTAKEVAQYAERAPTEHPQPVIRRLIAGREGAVVSASQKDVLRAVVHVHDAKTLRPLYTLNVAKVVESLAASSDGRFVAVADVEGNVLLWEPATDSIRQTWKLGYGYRPIRKVAFSPDGRYLATANANGTAYLLEVPQ